MAPNPSTHASQALLSYQLSADADAVEIKVYAPSTALVLHIKDGAKNAGWVSSGFDVSSLGNGLYFVRVKAISGSNFGRSYTIKFLLLR
jgi:hypothetical protein